MAVTYDAVIIGAAINGLVCGAYLAKAGMRTLVVERRHVIGGAAVTEEVVPGLRWSVASVRHEPPLAARHRRARAAALRPQGAAANDLFCRSTATTTSSYHDDVAKTASAVRSLLAPRRRAYPAFNQYLLESTAIIRRLLYETPVDPRGVTGRRSRRRLASVALTATSPARCTHRRSDDAERLRLSRPLVRERCRQDGARLLRSIGTFAGPNRPAPPMSSCTTSWRAIPGAGGWGFVRGGMGAISNAIADSGKRFGLEIRTSAPVAKVKIAGGRRDGVVLASGEEIAAKLVVSNASCKMLFLNLVDRDALPAEFVAEIESYRTFSTAFKINIAAEAPPRYRSFDKAKAGFDYPTTSISAPRSTISRRPMTTPSTEPTRPPLHHAGRADHRRRHAGAGGQACRQPFRRPRALCAEERRLGDERDKFVRGALDVVDSFRAGFLLADHRHAGLLPPDLEELLALPQGHIFHGELSPDQLFFQRPAPHYADYRAPVRRLYQLRLLDPSRRRRLGIPATTPRARSSWTGSGDEGL